MRPKITIRHSTLPFAVIATSIVAATVICWIDHREQRRIDVALADCRALIGSGEQGWGDEVAARIRRLKKETGDKRLLARRLLAEQDGSLAAEGMVIVAEEGLRGGDRTLAAFAGDRRWNYWLDDNAHWSRLCLAIWKLKTKMPLDAEDRRSLAGYEPVIRATFEITVPTPPSRRIVPPT